MKEIYLAGGCFWGVQRFFDQFDGVIRTEVGYANGPDSAPSYREVCDSSGHAETVRIDYDEDKIYVVGESVSQYDLKKCFARDTQVTSLVSILAVLVVLLFTFKSVGMPILLILVIQGSIWINFSIPALQHDYLFFLGYLIVSSIQMGANIDYAIQEASNAGWNKNERIFFYGTGGNQQSPAFYKYYRVKIQYK